MINDRLKKIIEEFKIIEKKLAQPEISTDSKKLKELSGEHARLSEIVTKIEELNKINSRIVENNEIVAKEKDKGIVTMAESELTTLKEKKEELEKQLKVDLLPVDKNDRKNVIAEIRAGAGGDEAGIFGADLMRMYQRYGENNRWKV
ncbi:PCRF domain-containing protein, partial [Patescibacteria group bacterium]|nr:PCRF domain-containing protein [Patescibacteria group bacterium]